LRKIYLDGSCRKNPGIGAYAWIDFTNKIKCVSPLFKLTTNNRMELLSLLSFLIYILRKMIRENLKEEKIIIFTDSKYLFSGLNHWYKNWIIKGKKFKNKDIWIVLFNLWKYLIDILNFNLILKWVKGHSKIKGNEIVHELCFKKTFGGI